MKPATVIVLTSGGMVFFNEWYQSKQINWRVPVATLLLAAAFDGLAALDNTIATMLAAMVFIGAGTATFGTSARNQRSAFGTLAGIFGKK